MSAAEATHPSQILFVVHPVDHRTRAEEQQRLVEGVRDQEEHGDPVGAHPGGHEHEAELADRGVREHALDVLLRERRTSPRTAPSRAPDHEHDGQRDAGELEEHVRADHEVDAGGHHRRGVDQRRDRASGPPSRRAATRAAGSAPTCRSRRRTAAARSTVAASLVSTGGGRAEDDLEVERAEPGRR